MRNIFISPASFVLLALPLSAFAADGRAGVVELMIEQARCVLGAPAITAAVVVDDERVWSGSSCLADVENMVSAQPDHVSRIGSVSKPIVATAVMQLVERGLVGLNDPIRDHVPAFPRKPEGEITIRHVLSHTSGIRHDRAGEALKVSRFDSLDEAIALFADDPLLHPPGSAYEYSSFAYNLLAGVVESASGQTFEEDLQGHIFAPVGMRSSRLDHLPRVVPGRMQDYDRSGKYDVLINAPHADLSYKWAGGGMLSTAEDLARFHIALDRGPRPIGPQPRLPNSSRAAGRPTRRRRTLSVLPPRNATDARPGLNRPPHRRGVLTPEAGRTG